MSQENVEIVRSIFAAWERGDYSSAEWAHPEIGLVVPDGPTPGSWTGVAAMVEAWRDALSAFEELRSEADEYRALDDERVLVLMHFSGRGKTSGLEVGDIQMKGANLFDVRGGKVTRLVLYWDRERAFADLGLEEQAMSQENAEIVRRIAEAFEAGVERGDFGAAWETGAVATDVEFIALPEMMEQRSYRGQEGFVEFMRRWTEDFEGYSVETERLIDAGNDRVVGFLTQSGTGTGSGASVVQEYAVIYDLKDGQLVRLRAYLDRDEALEAAGLRG